MKRVALLPIFAFALAACAQATPLPTPTALPTASVSPTLTETLTPTPTITLTPEPTATATITKTPAPHPAQVFAEPFLTFIAGRPPTFQDDFSQTGQGWRKWNDLPLTGTCETGDVGYEQGEYMLRAEAGACNRVFGNNQLFAETGRPVMSNYVAEIELHWVSGYGAMDWMLCDAWNLEAGTFDCLDLRLRSQDGWLDLYAEKFYFRNQPKQPQPGVELGTAASGANFSQPVVLTVVKHGLELAIFVNQRPVLYGKLSAAQRLRLNYVELRLANNSTKNPAEVHWDNLKVWVLNP